MYVRKNVPTIYIVIRFGKNSLIHTTIEIHFFLYVRESYTHALPKDTKYLKHKWFDLLSQTAFC